MKWKSEQLTNFMIPWYLFSLLNDRAFKWDACWFRLMWISYHKKWKYLNVNLEILKQNLYDRIPVYGDSFFTDTLTIANAQDTNCFYVDMLLLYLDTWRNSRTITDLKPGFSVLIQFISVNYIFLYFLSISTFTTRQSYHNIKKKVITIIIII